MGARAAALRSCAGALALSPEAHAQNRSKHFISHPSPPPEPLPYTKLIAHARFPHPAPACSPTAAFPPLPGASGACAAGTH